MPRYGDWVDVPAGRESALPTPPRRIGWFFNSSGRTIYTSGRDVQWTDGPLDSYAAYLNFPVSLRGPIEYHELNLLQFLWGLPNVPNVPAPAGVTVEYERHGFDIELEMGWVYPQDITGRTVKAPYTSIRVAPLGDPLDVQPTAVQMDSWERVDRETTALTDPAWGFSESGEPHSRSVRMEIPRESLPPEGSPPSTCLVLTTTPSVDGVFSVTGGEAAAPGVASLRPIWYFISAKAVWRPWRYRFVYSSGMWATRQRQTLPGTVGGWPLRQRQNGNATGSWPLRQRQTGT